MLKKKHIFICCLAFIHKFKLHIMKSAYLEQKIAKYASILLFQSINLKNELLFLKDY